MPVESYAVEPVHKLLDDVDPQRRLAPCGLRRLVLGSNAISTVADTVAELLAQTGGGITTGCVRVALLVDATPISRLGTDVKALVQGQLEQRFVVERTVLEDGQRELHVVDDVLDAATRALTGVDAVVALGGGTISDIGKAAASRIASGGRGPVLVTVQTAASVDGYTDDVSVLLRDGVKRTVATCWPDGVVADAETIAEAPAGMNRAGFGEMTSMLVAPADWRLASLVGTDNSFHHGAIRLLRVVGADIDSWSKGVHDGHPQSVASLTRALALRGIATGVAGTTAVLSGVEHLISHMFDQYHTQRHLPMGLHGAQVGVGSVVAAAAWEMLFDRLGTGAPRVRLEQTALDPARARARVVAAFDFVDPTGRVAAECWRDYSAKLQVVANRRARVQSVLANWQTHDAELRALVRPAADIAAGLTAAGAAAGRTELDPQIGDELLRWAVGNCALMRNRFTVVDLLTLLGWWDAPDVDEVLDRSRQAAAAAGLRR